MIASSSRPAVAGLYTGDTDGRPLLIASLCRACGERAFPVRVACAVCLSTDLEQSQYGPAGELYAFTLVHEAFGRGSLPTPYGVAKVRFDDGFMVQGLMDPAAHGWQVGQRVETSEIVLEMDGESQLLTYAFRPINPKAEVHVHA